MADVFPLIPPTGRTTAFFAAVMVIPVLLALVLGWLWWGSSNTTAELRADALRIRSPMYGRTIPYDSLDIAAARVVDVRRETSLRPRTRTNGVGLPGYGAGWFRLQDGSRALMFSTQPRMVHIPTRNGYVVMMSVREPEAFLERLRGAG